MTRRLLVVAAALFVCLPSPARGHGVVADTQPEENAVVKSPPGKVTMTLTETPTEDAVLRVVDGCDRQVAGAVSVNGETLSATLDDPHPGHFRVQWKIISAVDGHPTDGRFAFHVTGKPRCNEPEEEPEGEDDGTENAGDGGNDSAAPAAGAGESGDFPVVPVAIGVVGVVGLALIARRAGAR